MSIGVDSLSIRSQHFQTKTNREITSTTRKLASGKRITQASDDAARLAIATKLNAKNRGQSQAMRNANDAISVIQMAEGSLQGTRDGISRAKELALQASNGSYSAGERVMIQKELNHILQEIDRRSDITSVFGHSLLNGKSSKIEIQADAVAGTHGRMTIDMKELETKTSSLGIQGLSFETQESARSSLKKLDNALQKVSRTSALIGSYQNRFQSTMDNLGHSITNGQAAHSQFMDADFAKQTAKMVTEKIKQDYQTSVPAQISDSLRSATKLL